MSIDTFLPIQAALQGAGLIAAVVAVGYLAAAILGWRGPNRKRRLIRFALFLVAIPICMGIHVALLHGVVLPSIARNADKARQARIDDVSIVQIGDAAPSFTVTDTNGDQFNLGDLRGKVALVNFFATWCGSCLKELPHLQKLWDDNRDNGDFALIVIGREETNESVTAFRSKNGYTFPVASDPERAIYSLFATELIPRTYLVSSEGRICFTSTGFYEEDMARLQKELAKQLQSSR
jgi:peroxiredoxin